MEKFLKKNACYPFVTVIMPVRNEEAYIQRSLESVLQQDYPAERIEILVADGMSDDGTRRVVEQFQERHGNIQLVDNPRRIVPTGMNAALRKARGEVIIRIDGHCEIARDYISRCVELLNTHEVDGVGGPIQTCGETSMARVIAAAMSHPFGVGDSMFRIHLNLQPSTPDRLVDSVPFPAYTRQVIQQAGPYDEELVRNQDDEYNYRLRKLGARILLSGEVHSLYYSRGNLPSLWRQYFWYGFWKVRVLQKHPMQMQLRQFVPPAFVAFLVCLLVLSLGYPFALSLLAIVLGTYAVLLVLVSLLIGLQKQVDWHLVSFLPLAFIILHFSYGIGFLSGLVRFASRWGNRPGLEW